MSTSMFPINGAFITAEKFNSIKDIHDQSPLNSDTIAELGEIFKKHNVVDKHMLGLLHRHYSLPDNALAITTEVSPDVAVTKITYQDTVDKSALRGQLYFLDSENEWQAYEYEFGAEPVFFKPEFLNELGAAIVANGLKDKVSLASSTHASNTSEFQLAPNATVTISSPALDLEEGEYFARAVAWAFSGEGDELALPGNYQYRTTTKNHTQLYFQANCSALLDPELFHFDNPTDVLRELKKHGYLK